MGLFHFSSVAFGRRLGAQTGSSSVVLMLLALTVPVLGWTAVSHSLARAAQQEISRQDEAASSLDEAELPTEEMTAASIATVRATAIAEVKAAVAGVRAPDPQALARALRLELGREGEASEAGRLEPLGDLDGDEVPEMVLQWVRPIPRVAESGEKAGLLSVFFLLAWDGARWRPTHLLEGSGLFTWQVVPLLRSTGSKFIVLTSFAGAAVPYPVLFQFKRHGATLVWDSRADDSRYQGYRHGRIVYQDEDGDGILELVAMGRADPGLLVFPPEGSRGFEVRAVYAWNGKAFVPAKVEYSANEDYVLYRFVSALHLRDFRSAYALIDPAKFLKTQEPSLEAFRKQVESAWPEFLADSIFEAADGGETLPRDFCFKLELEDKVYTYYPDFSRDARLLLTGLERREER